MKTMGKIGCSFVLVLSSGLLFAVEVIQLDSGPISGKSEAGLSIYLGIPYAAPPVGPLR